jgi:phosphate transport system substrate-binding protein
MEKKKPGRAMRNLKNCWILLTGLAACTSGSEQLDNPKRGTITIAADESLRPLVDELTSGYEGIYPETHFKVDFKPEQNAILQLLQDSARIAFVTRELQEKELSMLKGQKSSYQVQNIAIDGLAVIVSRENSDSLMLLSELRAIFEGRITTWTQMKGSNQSGDITLVFDSANSSNLNFVMEKFGLKELGGIRIISAGSNEKVVAMVKSNPNYLGFIGVSWISNGHSLASEELSNGLNVFGISKVDTPKSIKEYYQPFQSGLVYKNYPLSREVYILSREGYPGLGGGLMTYIARDVGGLIIDKMGLLPRVPYPRELEVRSGQNF